MIYLSINNNEGNIDILVPKGLDELKNYHNRKIILTNLKFTIIDLKNFLFLVPSNDTDIFVDKNNDAINSLLNEFDLKIDCSQSLENKKSNEDRFSFNNDFSIICEETLKNSKENGNRSSLRLVEVMQKDDYFLDFKRVLTIELSNELKNNKDIMNLNARKDINIYGIISSIVYSENIPHLVIIKVTSIINSNELRLNYYDTNNTKCPFEIKQIIYIMRGVIKLAYADLTIFVELTNSEFSISEENITDDEYNKMIKFKSDYEKYHYDFLCDLYNDRKLVRYVVKVINHYNLDLCENKKRNKNLIKLQ